MKRLILILAVASLGACAADGQTAAPGHQLRGQRLVEVNCGACHATGLTDESPAPEAPALRILSRNYRVANLEEALAEGISVGHPAMPQFQFAPDDVSAVITYLQSIQVQPDPPTQ